MSSGILYMLTLTVHINKMYTGSGLPKYLSCNILFSLKYLMLQFYV